jgi:transcriptional regulator with XRE-family HTH domain
LDVKRIGENIRFYRNLRSLTQTALAREVHVAPAYISQIEANQRVPSLKVTRRIADVLGIEMSVLVREADPRAEEGRLSDSEKLDLLRTLIMAIEGESRAEPPSSDVRTISLPGIRATELHSEPSYAVVFREYTGEATFGRESDELDVENHVILEGEVRVLDAGSSRPLHVGDSHSLAGPGSDRLHTTSGARVLSVYAPRVPLHVLFPAAASKRSAIAG